MDTESLFNQARARFEHESARKILREKYQAKMIFAYREGMWRAGPDLLILLQACTDDDPVLLDLYESPIRVNRNELQSLVASRWQEQMTAWQLENAALHNRR